MFCGNASKVDFAIAWLTAIRKSRVKEPRSVDKWKCRKYAKIYLCRLLNELNFGNLECRVRSKVLKRFRLLTESRVKCLKSRGERSLPTGHWTWKKRWNPKKRKKKIDHDGFRGIELCCANYSVGGSAHSVKICSQMHFASSRLNRDIKLARVSLRVTSSHTDLKNTLLMF